MESERKKVTKLEERNEELVERVDKLKAALEEVESSRRKLREEIDDMGR